MYFFIEKSNQIKKRCENLDITFNDIYEAAVQAVYERYSLPALHTWEDGFTQGDATIEELIELKNAINQEAGDEPLVYFEIDDEDEINTDIYQFLDQKLIEVLEENMVSLIRKFGDEEYTKNSFDKYKDNAEALINEFLNKEYPFSPNPTGYDYSVFFLADEMRVFEMVQASSNWMFQTGNDARFRITHLNNYDSPFEECDYDLVVIECERPNAWDEMSYDEKKQWFEENLPRAIEECHNYNRDEQIQRIVDSVEWDEIEQWFNAQFNKED